MEKKRCYGILFDITNYSEDINIYKPSYLIKGTYIEEDLEGLSEKVIFQDELDNYYYSISQSLKFDINRAVDFVISSEELKKDYQDLTIEEAKREYFNSFLGTIYFGSKNSNKSGIFKVKENAIMDNTTENIFSFLEDLKTKINRKYESILYIEKFDLAIERIKEINKYLDSIEINNKELTEKEKLEVKIFIDNIQSCNNTIMKLKNIYSLKSGISDIQINELEQEEIHLQKQNVYLTNKIKDINVVELKEYLDEIVIGQEEAKKDVITTIVKNSLAEKKQERNACLLIGPTGSGKTLIFETISKYLNIPLLIIDTTQLSVPGYVGTNIEEYLMELINRCNGNITEAEKAIVVFDEIDKKRSKSNSNVAGKGVLNCLLSFIQGTTYLLSNEGVMGISEENNVFDTSNLTIFATGAFTDLVDNKKKQLSKKEIGFTNNQNKEIPPDIYITLDTEDFTKQGEMPIELIGRFDTITCLKEHDKNSLKEILTKSQLSPLLVEQKKLKKLEVDLSVQEDYIDSVVEKALNLKTGARSLKSIINNSLREGEWKILCNPHKYKEIILTKDTIKDNRNFTLITNDEKKEVIKDYLNEDKKITNKVLTKSRNKK